MSVLNVRDFGAVGDGVTDDLPSFRLALAQANEGDTILVPNPSNYYYFADDPGNAALSIDKSVALLGESRMVFGLPSCAIEYDNTDAPVIEMTREGSSEAIAIENLQIRGGQDGIVFRPEVRVNRHGGFRNLRITAYARYGIYGETDFTIPDSPTSGGSFSCSWRDCQVGGNSGESALRIEDATSWIQTKFENCRFSGARTANPCVFVRSSGPGYDTVHFDTCIFEQNDGPACDVQGGLKVVFRDCWFEQNCQVFGPDNALADGSVLLGGQADDTGDPFLKAHSGSNLGLYAIFDGCNWSSPGAENDAKIRIYFARRGVRLHIRDNRLLGSDVVDGANRSSSAGMILSGITLPTVINWPASRIYVLGTNDPTIPDEPSTPTVLSNPDVIGSYRGRLRAGRGVTYFPTTEEQTTYNDLGPWPAVIQSVNASGSVNLQVTVPQNQLAALTGDDIYGETERDMLNALRDQFQTRLDVRQGAKGQKGVYVL